MAESQARIGIFADDRASATVKSVQGHLQGLAAEAKRSILTGVGLAGGVAAFQVLSNTIRGTIDYVGDAIEAGSRLAESQNKVDVVFGDSAQEIQDWASDSATAFGQSEQAALEAVGTYGNLFQAFGLGREESARMSKSLVELAADLASFNNTPVDDALVALRSGLSGETEPLKRFGIALNDARMRSVLAAQGVTNLGATLTAAQKATAAYAIIMSDSALAQGDFERTSDGLANQQRILAAELDNLSAEIGTQLLPVMVELAHVANESLVPALRTVLEAFKILIEVMPELDASMVPVIGDIVDAIGSLGVESERVAEVMAASGQTTASNWTAMGRAIQAATEDTTTAVVDDWEGAREDVAAAARMIPAEVAKAMIDGQKDVEAGVELLTQLLEDEWTDASRLAYLKGQLIVAQEGLAGGIAQGDSAAVAQARALIEHIETEIERIESGAYAHGATAGLNLGYALTGTLPHVSQAARGLANATTGPLRGVEGSSYGIGQNTGYYYSQGLYSASSYVFGAAQYLAGIVAHHLEFAGSPPYTRAKKIGAKVAEVYGEALSGGLQRLQDISGILPGGRSEGFASGFGAMAGIGTHAQPIVVQLQVDGRTLAEIVTRESYYMAPTTALYPKG